MKVLYNEPCANCILYFEYNPRIVTIGYDKENAFSVFLLFHIIQCIVVAFKSVLVCWFFPAGHSRTRRYTAKMRCGKRMCENI